MSVLEIKNDLLRLMGKTNDSLALTKARIFFKMVNEEELSTEEFNVYTAQLAEIGLKQAEAGKLTSHSDVRRKIDKLLKK